MVLKLNTVDQRSRGSDPKEQFPCSLRAVGLDGGTGTRPQSDGVKDRRYVRSTKTVKGVCSFDVKKDPTWKNLRKQRRSSIQAVLP